MVPKKKTRAKAKKVEPVKNTMSDCHLDMGTTKIEVAQAHLTTVSDLASAIKSNAEAISKLADGLDLSRVEIVNNSVGIHFNPIEGENK